MPMGIRELRVYRVGAGMERSTLFPLALAKEAKDFECVRDNGLWRCRECSEFTSAFGGIADIAGLATGSTRS